MYTDKAAYTVDEFCNAYRIGRTFTYSQINAGRLKIVKAGRRTLVPVEAAREWFTNLQGEA